MRILLLIFLPFISLGQIPETDIYLANISKDFKVDNIRNVTKRKGYDNQPCFFSNTKFRYVSNVNGQTDVYERSVADSTMLRITNTAESEYSPLPSPFGAGFLCVVVEKDSSQHIWQFSMDGKTHERVNDMDSIGYHCWPDKDQAAVFVLTKPFSLQIMEKDGKSTKADTGIGRCLKNIPGSKDFSFVKKTQVKNLLIRYKRPSGQKETITELPEGTENMEWLDPTHVISSKDASLYIKDISTESEWRKITEKVVGIKAIQRIAISPDKKHIAFVGLE